MNGLQDWLLANHHGTSNRSNRDDRAVTLDIEEREVIQRRMRTQKWTLDRGAGYYASEREKKKLPCLVQTGKHAGRSRVRYVGVDSKTFWSHVLRRDFFTTAVNAKLIQIVGLLVVWYFLMLLSWSTIYYLIWRWNNSCFIGFHGFRSAFMYATETQQTIGYGERATGECWASALMVSIHSLQAVLLDSVILGIVFSRIAHPKNRSRTVLLSDSACIARRDGQLKFMFRIADIQMRSVIDPRVRVVMYTWGPGRRTAEGERIPVTAQDMTAWLDSALLLPVTVEHDIDEASPLFGHTLQSLEAVGAEIVVTFEASSELGDTFMARQSYLPSEIHWGHTFTNIIRYAARGDTQFEVDLSRFHDVEPQPGLGDELTQPHRLSRKVVAGGGGSGVVPGRLLFENTLVLSEDAVVTCRNGRPYLMFRLGDTLPGNVIDVQVSAHLYRWQVSHTSEGEMLPYDECPLELQPANIMLRYPATLLHELDPARSPVAHWAAQKGMRQDADAEVVVTAKGTLYSRQTVVTRTRVYSVLGDIKWGHAFQPVVLPATSAAALGGASSKLGAAVDWSRFHTTAPVTMPQLNSYQQQQQHPSHHHSHHHNRQHPHPHPHSSHHHHLHQTPSGGANGAASGPVSPQPSAQQQHQPEGTNSSLPSAEGYLPATSAAPLAGGLAGAPAAAASGGGGGSRSVTPTPGGVGGTLMTPPVERTQSQTVGPATREISRLARGHPASSSPLLHSPTHSHSNQPAMMTHSQQTNEPLPQLHRQLSNPHQSQTPQPQPAQRPQGNPPQLPQSSSSSALFPLAPFATPTAAMLFPDPAWQQGPAQQPQQLPAHASAHQLPHANLNYPPVGPVLPRFPALASSSGRAPLQRSVSSMLLTQALHSGVAGGGEGVGSAMRSTTSMGFVGAPSVSMSHASRRTDEGFGLGISDDPSSTGNTHSYASGGLMPYTWGARRHTGSGLVGGPQSSTQGDRSAEKSWHQTRSLFTALESIQLYLQEEEMLAMQQQQQQQQEQEQQGDEIAGQGL